MSLEAPQSCLISFSDSWTCLPGLADRTSVSRLIISSTTARSIVTWPCAAIGIFFSDPPPPPSPLGTATISGNPREGVGLVGTWYFCFFFFLSLSQCLRLYLFLCCGLFWWVYRIKNIFSGKKSGKRERKWQILFFIINLFMLLRGRDWSVKL